MLRICCVLSVFCCLAGCKTLMPGSGPNEPAREDTKPQEITVGRDGSLKGLPERKNLHGLTLHAPKVKGKKVEINGVVELPVQAIAWDWGDQTFDEQWFPAEHKFASPGVYRIRALTVDAQGGQSLVEVAVQVE